MKRLITTLSLFALTFMAIVAPGAWAHSQVLSQNPAPSSQIAQLPATVEIVFNEKLISLGEGNDLQVLDPEGNEVTIGDTTATASKLIRGLSASTAPGEYYVSYRAVSTDGHVVAGEYTFELSPNSSESKAPDIAIVPPPAEDESGELKFKVIGALGFLLLIGGAFFIAKSRAKK